MRFLMLCAVALATAACELPARGGDSRSAAPVGAAASQGARLRLSADGKQLELENGLVRRSFRLEPNCATVAFDDLRTGTSLLRGVRPEARVQFQGGRQLDVGGLRGPKVENFLRAEDLSKLEADPAALRFSGYREVPIEPPFDWKPRSEWLSRDARWPPKGVGLALDFSLPAPLDKLVVRLRYELYDGLPLLVKWLEIEHGGGKAVVLEHFSCEILAVTERESMVDSRGPSSYHPEWRLLQVETDMSFGGSMAAGADSPAVHWLVDPQYTTQVDYERRMPCLLECKPSLGPGQRIEAGETWRSMRCVELVHDTTEREARGLAVRGMYRALAPWVQENPLIFHVRSADPASVRAGIDQAAQVGFEVVLMSFGSGFDIENRSPAYLQEIKELVDYAHARGIALGGYSLLASRSVSPADDVVNPATGKPGGFARFDNSPCLCSKWGLAYFDTLRNFFEVTGADALEHDGSYPGDVCASTTHPGHTGLADSQWNQWRLISDFYAWCRGRGIYLNVPDWYYLNGSSKCGMGYRETNWSLPRADQELIERQNIFDGTFDKTPSMGWMFVPLTEYQGGGPAATIEPLAEHLDHYAMRLRNLLGAGVQACWRGPRLYDTEETKALVAEWVTWFKQHRRILESDLLHGRRPDGCDLDWMVHVDPGSPSAAMLVVHNPLDVARTRTLDLDLWPAGLAGRLQARIEDSNGLQRGLWVEADACGQLQLELTVPARGMTWVELGFELD